MSEEQQAFSYVGGLISLRGVTLADVAAEQALGDAVADFMLDRRSRRLSPRTIEFYELELRLFCEWAAPVGVARLGDVTSGVVRRGVGELGGRRGPGGGHASYRALKAWLRWCWLEFEMAGRCPMDRVAPPRRPRELLAPVEVSTVQALLDACGGNGFLDVRDRAILGVLLDTGLRASELLALRKGDIDEAGRVAVAHGKGDKARVVFLVEGVLAAVRRYRRFLAAVPDGGPLWLTDQGRALRYGGLVALMRRRARAAGGEAPTWHSFRRAFALGALRAGADVPSLRLLMGHESTEVLVRYLALDESDLAGVHGEVSPARGLRL